MKRVVTATILGDESGAAFLEALVVLPVLFLTLAGVVAIEGMYGAKLEAMSLGRRAAWLDTSAHGCRAHRCVGTDCTALEAEIRADGVDQLASTRASGSSLSSFVEDSGPYFRAGTAEGLGEAEAPIPRIFGSGSTTQRGRTVLLCNASGGLSGAETSILERACSTELSTMEYASEVCP